MADWYKYVTTAAQYIYELWTNGWPVQLCNIAIDRYNNEPIVDQYHYAITADQYNNEPLVDQYNYEPVVDQYNYAILPLIGTTMNQ